MTLNVRTPEVEAAEDIFFGQIVIIWARWFLIAAGTVLMLWTMDNVSALTRGIIPVIALMAINFYLHGRYAVEKPANRLLIMTASVLDLMIVTLIILLWPGAKGFDSQYFILYYPMLLTFAFVFPHGETAIYGLAALLLYTGVCFWVNPGFLKESADQQFFALKLVTMAATSGLGTYYWRIQRNRRRESAGGALTG